MTPWLLAVAEDLMFAVQIQNMAKAAGLGVRFVKTSADAIGLMHDAPRGVVIDLNQPGLDAVALIGSLKRIAPDTPLICFVSHVQTALRQAAAEAGAEHVIPRSAFATRMPGLLAAL